MRAFKTLFLLALTICLLCGCTAAPKETTGPQGTTAPAIESNVTYYADIVIGDFGTVTVELDQKAAPLTVANFVKLANEGYYNGLTFHRIMNTFMMQGGDIDGDGYSNFDKDNIYGEFAANGWNNPLSHTRGVISMARSDSPDSASTQFFIVHQDSLFLDGQYAAFGIVTEGMEVVDAICAAARPLDGNGKIAPEDQPVMTSVTIRTE